MIAMLSITNVKENQFNINENFEKSKVSMGNNLLLKIIMGISHQMRWTIAHYKNPLVASLPAIINDPSWYVLLHDLLL